MHDSLYDDLYSNPEHISNFASIKKFPLKIPEFSNNRRIKNFSGTDSEQRFIDFKSYLKDRGFSGWRYENIDISYEVNSLGYRYVNDFDENFDWSNKIPVLGCSHVFGVGNPMNETIPSYLGNLTKDKYEVVNMGTPGGSNKQIFYNAMWLLTQNIKDIVVIWSYDSRWNYIHRNYVAPSSNSFQHYHTYKDEDKINYVFTQLSPHPDMSVDNHIYKKVYKPEFAGFNETAVCESIIFKNIFKRMYEKKFNKLPSEFNFFNSVGAEHNNIAGVVARKYKDNKWLNDDLHIDMKGLNNIKARDCMIMPAGQFNYSHVVAHHGWEVNKTIAEYIASLSERYRYDWIIK